MLVYVKRECILAFHSIFRSSFIFILWSLTSIFFIKNNNNNNKNNCGCTCNCSPEPEFIEEIVEIIWKILYEESPTSTIPPCRQNDVPGQCSSLIIPQKDALSGQNAIAERTRPFFFKKNFFLHVLQRMFGIVYSKLPPALSPLKLCSSRLSHFPMQDRSTFNSK